MEALATILVHYSWNCVYGFWKRSIKDITAGMMLSENIFAKTQVTYFRNIQFATIFLKNEKVLPILKRLSVHNNREKNLCIPHVHSSVCIVWKATSRADQ